MRVEPKMRSGSDTLTRRAAYYSRRQKKTYRRAGSGLREAESERELRLTRAGASVMFPSGAISRSASVCFFSSKLRYYPISCDSATSSEIPKALAKICTAIPPDVCTSVA